MVGQTTAINYGAQFLHFGILNYNCVIKLELCLVLKTVYFHKILIHGFKVNYPVILEDKILRIVSVYAYVT